MAKGALILLLVFSIIAILHWFSLKMIRLEENKKANFRKVFWYFYGIIFSLSGSINLIEKEEWNFIFIFQTLIGLSMIVLNFLGKISTKSNT